MSTASYLMKEGVYTPMIKVIFSAIRSELNKDGFISLGKVIHAVRYAYCEEQLWRRVQQSQKEFAEGKGKILNSFADLD